MGSGSQKEESSVESTSLFPLKGLWCFSVRVWAKGEYVSAPKSLSSRFNRPARTNWVIAQFQVPRRKNMVGSVWISCSHWLQSTVARKTASGEQTWRAGQDPCEDRSPSLWSVSWECSQVPTQVKGQDNYLLRPLNQGKIRPSTSNNINCSVILAISGHVSWIQDSDYIVKDELELT